MRECILSMIEDGDDVDLTAMGLDARIKRLRDMQRFSGGNSYQIEEIRKVNMKKYFKAVIFVMCIGFFASMFSGCRIWQVLDGDGMVNKQGLMLGALEGCWQNDDEKWDITIDGNSIVIQLGGLPVYDGTFSFKFYGYDTDVRTELVLTSAELSFGDTVTGSVFDFYSEAGELYLVVDYPDGGSDEIIFSRTEETIEVFDGFHTYVDNDILLPSITGLWISLDQRYSMCLSDDYNMVITLDDETVLSSRFYFSYLMPRDPEEEDDTEIDVHWCDLRHGDGTAIAEIVSVRYDAGESGDKIILVLCAEDSDNVTVEFYKE